MALIEVIRPGARSLLQDLGFVRARALGVPAGGVMDPAALRLLNALLGDPPGTEAIEVALTAPVLRVARGAVRVALAGMPGACIRAPDGAERALPPWCATTLAEGEELVPAPPARGGIGLIGIGGGIAVPRILGSRSTCLSAGFGGLEGRALRAGDRLSCADAAPGLPDLQLEPPPPGRGPIRVVPGPQADCFGPEDHARLLATPWRVSPRMDRMGLRLEGPPLGFAPGRGPDIISDGIAPGAIQVPGNGLPIILLADAQTTGGYAKIATVIRADLPRLAALVPGDEIRLAAVSVAEAEAAARAAAAAEARAIAGIAPRAAAPREAAGLLALNLVGGAVDAAAPDHFPGHL